MTRTLRWLLALAAIAAAPIVRSAPNPLRNGSTPAVSPDGRRIAFASDRDQGVWSIYVMDANGGSAARLTDAPDIDGPPVWLDGGKRIAYQSISGDSATLRCVELDGKQTRILVTLAAKSIVPSHDGRHVAYTAGSWTRNQIMLADSNGSNARALTDGAGASYNLAWSPDDRRIAYTHVDALRDMQVWVMKADGTGAHPITHFTASDGRPQWPAWSPDGQMIAIQAGVNDRRDPALNTGHIWLIDLATRSAMRLAGHERRYVDETPSWFPDNSHLAFQSNRTGRMEIWVMDIDGAGARQLTR